MIGPYTIEHWLDLPPSEDGSRTELIFGHLHVTPAPSGEHQYVAGNLIHPLKVALAAGGRPDLYVVPAVNVKIASAWRIGLIPDIVVLNQQPSGVIFPPEAVVVAVEIWSPGNQRAERETKTLAYAEARVPFLWTIEQASKFHGWRLTAHRLTGEEYVAENVLEAGTPATITAAPVPITLDLADLTF
ncbi:Uma2 family endonuclease [Actinosynnema sp. NPDC059335]|uniref:Uma2 family endonuclease n=1 Tax=Actinosynnema sp. NPDC059335 TaxID=3346804 RepID=UPI00366B245D